MEAQRSISIRRKAFERWLTGLAFGGFVAIAIVLMSDTRPMKVIETWGEDLGMRVIGNPYLRLTKDYLQTATPFVFIDVDTAACEAFVGRERAASDCDNPSQLPPDMVLSILQSVTLSEPKVIVLDYQLPNTINEDSSDAVEKLKAYLTTDDGKAPVIAPAPLLPAARVGSAVLMESDRVINSFAAGRLRLASFRVWTDPVVGDGVIRNYPAFVSVNDRQSPPALFYLPSAPFLAALITEQESGLAAADALFYPDTALADCTALLKDELSVVNLAVPGLAENCGTSALWGPLNVQHDRRMIFSISSISLPVSADFRSNVNGSKLELFEAAYSGFGTVEGGMLYRRYPLRSFINHEQQDPFQRLTTDLDLKGQVVVIGSSAIEASDWHRTPLGAATGAEVIINATRAFADFRPISNDKSFLEKLNSKLVLTLIAAVSLFPFLLISVSLSMNPTTHVVSHVASLVFAQVVFLLGVMVSITIVWIWTYYQVTTKASPSGLDFLIPVLAIAFEGLVEMIHQGLEALEKGISKISALVFR